MLTYGFYNSVNHDRTYNAEEFSKLFDGLINDGVYERIGQVFAVTPSDGMVINVGSGRAWFNHTWTYNDSTIQMVIPESDLAYDRIDAVVIEVNSTANIRANTIKVIKGIPSASPEKPILTNADGVYQHALAYITVEARSTSISGSNIENAVGTNETPFVDAIVRTSSISNLWGVWKEEFDAWLQGLRDELDENQAGHLQNEIDALDAAKPDGIMTANIILSRDRWVTVTVSSNNVYYTYSLEDQFPSSQYRILNVVPRPTHSYEDRRMLERWGTVTCNGHFDTNVIESYLEYAPSYDINVTVIYRLKTQNESSGMDISSSPGFVRYAQLAGWANGADVTSHIYNSAYEVVRKTSSQWSISANSFDSGEIKFNIDDSPNEPIGIIGTTGTGYSDCAITEAYIEGYYNENSPYGNNWSYRIVCRVGAFRTASSTKTGTCKFDVLYFTANQ